MAAAGEFTNKPSANEPKTLTVNVPTGNEARFQALESFHRMRVPPTEAAAKATASTAVIAPALPVRAPATPGDRQRAKSLGSPRRFPVKHSTAQPPAEESRQQSQRQGSRSIEDAHNDLA